MALTLYNTLTRRKELFHPIDPGNVRMYVCGPTVYDYAHIGNARPVIVFDVLFRLLRHIYGESHVTYARNITDVDDKINARAAEEGISIRELTERTAKQFHEDIAALGVLPPTVEPRATEHIPGMVRLCEALIANGHAYVAEDHVLFDVGSMPDYGRLANRSLADMEAGARVDVAPYKKGPMDFVLWKPSKPGEPAWPSPAGIKVPGRPGWHIECSAMAEQHLGQVFDIHGGGIDLVFPHHENEIAQSRCAHGTPVMANYWMHNGFLQVEGEKMSKSLGNFVTINELLNGWRGFAWPGQIMRFAMLSTHYRQPIDFSQHALDQAWIALTHYKAVADAKVDSAPSDEFMLALMDDLNTPRAIAELHRLHKEIRERQQAMFGQMKQAPKGVTLDRSIAEVAGQLAAGLNLLGIDISTYDRDWAQNQNKDSAKVDGLIAARNAARKAKDFKEADRIRDELSGMGIQLKDAKDPATGEIVTTWDVKR